MSGTKNSESIEIVKNYSMNAMESWEIKRRMRRKAMISFLFAGLFIWACLDSHSAIVLNKEDNGCHQQVFGSYNLNKFRYSHAQNFTTGLLPIKMAPPSKVTLETALKILTDNFVGFENGCPAYNDPLWKVLAEKTKGSWTQLAWWVNITNDRRKLWTLARQRLGLPPLNPQTLTTDDLLLEEDVEIEEDDPELDELNNSELSEEETWWDLVISSELWDNIKPCDMVGKKKYSLFAGKWTNIIRDEFWRQFHLPCAFVFRRGEVFVSGNSRYFLRILGRCRSKSCGNKFYGIADHAPSELTGDLLIRVKTRDTIGAHEVIKCPLNGLKRKLIGKAAIGEGSNNLKKRMDREHLRRGDVEAPTIPSADQIRHAKKEAVDEQLGIRKEKGESVFDAIERMKFRHPFIGSIHDIGRFPFFVIYGTNEQITSYKLYRQTMKKRCSISIDSTSSVVRKIKQPLGQRGAAIFLYIITIHFHKSSLALFQMLSECQDAEKVTFWLRVWLRVVGWLKPCEVVVDYSPTLLAATCIAFNEINIKLYIQLCFNAVRLGEEIPSELMPTFIRIDIAHLVKAICDWKCFNQHPIQEVPEFFIRCMTLIADSQKFLDMVKLYALMSIVALHKFEDSKVRFQPKGTIITVGQARHRLISLMAERPRDINGFLKLAASEKEECNVQNDDLEVSDDIFTFFSKSRREAETTIELGNVTNFYYLPSFIDCAEKKMVQFPLWSAVCQPHYADHATSSYNERTFRDVKHEMTKNYGLPLSAERFLAVHITDILGGTKSFSSQIHEFRMKGNIVPDPIPKNQKMPSNVGRNTNKYPSHFDDSGLKSNENWRGRAESFTRVRCSNLESTRYSASDDNLNETPNLSAFENDEPLFQTRSNSPLPEFRKENDQDTIPSNDVSGKKEESIIFETPSPTYSNSAQDKSPEDRAFRTADKLLETPTKSPLIEYPEESDGDETPNDNFHDKEEDTVIFETPSPTRPNSDYNKAPRDLTPPECERYCNQWESQNDVFSALNTDHNHEDQFLKESPIISDTARTQTDRKRESISFDKPLSQGKYFRNYPEGRFNEVTAETIAHGHKFKNGSSDSYLLRNAAYCGNYNIDGQLNKMRNTCAFDSVVSILAMTAMDDLKYFHFIQENKDNTLFEFMIEFLENGATRDIYLKRFKLLKPHCKSVPAVTSVNNKKFITTYDATSSPGDIWHIFAETIPSVFRSYTCDNCRDIIEGDRSLFVNHTIVIQKGFSALQRALKFYPEIHNTNCHCGKNSIEQYNSNIHVFIELDIRTSVNAPPKSVKLDDIPKKLKFTTEYKLVGVVHRIGNHFTVYCLRRSGLWEKYDDLEKSKFPARKTTTVTPLVVIYIIDNVFERF